METQTPMPHGFGSWLWLAPTTLVCLIVPPTSFCLIGILLTGNVLVAYHRTFEIRRSEPTSPVFPDDEGHYSSDQPDCPTATTN